MSVWAGEGNKGSLHTRAASAEPSTSWQGRAPSPPPSRRPLLFPASGPDKPSVLPKAPNRLAAARRAAGLRDTARRLGTKDT